MAWTIRRVDVRQYTEEEAGLAYLAVGLAESPDLSGRYLEFQLGIDEDDRAEGYCIVDSPPEDDGAGDPLAAVLACAGHGTVYGGVTGCRLRGDQLTFTLTGAAQRVFGLPEELALRLDLSDADRSALHAGLTEVLSVPPPGAAPVVVDG